MKSNRKIANLSVAILFLLTILSQSFHQITHKSHHEIEHGTDHHAQNNLDVGDFEHCQLCDFIISSTPEISNSIIEFPNNYELYLETQFYWIETLFHLSTQNQKQLRAPPVLIIA